MVSAGFVCIAQYSLVKHKPRTPVTFTKLGFSHNELPLTASVLLYSPRLPGWKPGRREENATSININVFIDIRAIAAKYLLIRKHEFILCPANHTYCRDVASSRLYDNTMFLLFNSINSTDKILFIIYRTSLQYLTVL